jgi:hypothetical protein
MVIHNTQEGKLSLHEARMGIMQALTGYERSKKRYSPDDQQQINDNLAILAAELNFVFLPEYKNPELLEMLSPELSTLMQSVFPFEIRDSHHVEQLMPLAGLLDYGIKINLKVDFNPLPVIATEKQTCYGPVWHIDSNNILETDLIADEYIDALDYYKLYTRTKQDIYLQKLTTVLYRPNREVYSQNKLQIMPATHAQQVAAYYLFQCIQEYMHQRSAWKMLFETDEHTVTETGPKINMGMVEQLYSLSKDGFGSREEMGRLNLKEMLNLIVKQLKDAVATLRASKKKNSEIATLLNVPFNVIQML